VFGAFPNNIYVFDYFIKLTSASGYLLPQYATDTNDSHPNAAATTLVAPQLVNEVFNHSIAYEQVYGIRKIDESIPNKFQLEQNYPNPFNPATNIKYQIANNSFVTLKIYDILGREAVTLVNEQLEPGTYTIDWNASQFTSGIYFYRLQTKGFTDTKKLILLK
jgi:hypothetical protein